MSSKVREKAKKKVIRESEIQKKSAYLISKGWTNGKSDEDGVVHSYPNIPGEYMYRITPEGGGDDIVKTLCQATKIQVKWDYNGRF